jgi:hypothetical protein
LPNTSTLSSTTGTVVSNAAIVPAGAGGAISIYTSDATDVLFDINGYFAPPVNNGLKFYTLTPCRVADTRVSSYPAGLGPPSMSAGEQRSFPVLSSTCGMSASAAAYSFNFTVVPSGYLGIFTVWPSGLPEPGVSTLNSYDGRVVANAAIVPTGSGGAISINVTDPTNVLFDINGYFAPPQSTGLQFYPVTPCRVADTRGNGYSGALGPPTMGAGTNRSFPIPSGSCGIPATAAAYALSISAVPSSGYLGILTTWPTGQSQPNVSTMNSYDGRPVTNAAIVPAGSGGAISIYVTDATDVMLDISGYFAP